jgi:hypothetical protein
MDEVELGYALSATEDGTEGQDGYYFREFDPNSPFLPWGACGDAFATPWQRVIWTSVALVHCCRFMTR